MKLIHLPIIRFWYEYFTNKCADCDTTLIEFRNVHDTCKKCDLI